MNHAQVAPVSTWNWTVDNAEVAPVSTWNWTSLLRWTPRDPRAVTPSVSGAGRPPRRTNIMTNTAKSTWNWTVNHAQVAPVSTWNWT